MCSLTVPYIITALSSALIITHASALPRKMYFQHASVLVINHISLLHALSVPDILNNDVLISMSGQDYLLQMFLWFFWASRKPWGGGIYMTLQGELKDGTGQLSPKSLDFLYPRMRSSSMSFPQRSFSFSLVVLLSLLPHAR